jgi:tetratricopeptide (TPR) repeat protein
MAEHDEPIESVKTGETAPSPAEYLRSIKSLLMKSRQRDAYGLVQNAVVLYADDPFLLSYYGYLEALMDGKYRNGIETCTRAIALFQKRVLLDEDNSEEAQNAVLYLNLGRAYLAAEKKMDAVDTLTKGLHFDKRNRDILAELKKLGIRKIIPLPFLTRSHPVNAFIGRMLRKTRQQPDK